MRTWCSKKVTWGMCLLAAVLHAAPAAADPVPFPRAPIANRATFSGRNVRALLVHDGTLYVGGSFRVTQNGVTRNNLAAFDLNGNLRPEFAPNPNGIVRALATDGNYLFVGGEFTRLALKGRLAAVDLHTGAVKRDFTAHIAGVLDVEARTGVRALAVVNDTTVDPPLQRLIVGGNFSRVNDVVDNRSGLCALDIHTGYLEPQLFNQGVEGGPVDALHATTDTVFVGGAFTKIQNRSASLAALNFKGVLQSGSFSTSSQPVLALDSDPAGGRLFAAVGGSGNRAFAFRMTGSRRGSQLWQGPRYDGASHNVGGDVQTVHYFGGNLYFGFHDGMFVEPDIYKMGALDAETGQLEVDRANQTAVCSGVEGQRAPCWLPELDSTTGAQGFFGLWTITHYVDPVTNLATLIIGGEFTQVSGVSSARRLALFAEPAPEPPPPPIDPTPPPATGEQSGAP
ncbi:MAG TPA: hypothetical protein VFQ61_03515 [Polyangiaceae bacterium]|nr:hypothetical protein [Polyangiaceae bacterium]